MRHPRNRAERRHVRDYVIAYRRYIYLHVWNQSSYSVDSRNNPLNRSFHIEKFSEWGRYSKWNLNCTCKLCHWEKHGKENSKRRFALKTADADWEQHEEIAHSEASWMEITSNAVTGPETTETVIGG